MKKVGILGYGHLGQYLCDRILADKENFELVFVWNRSAITDSPLDKNLILTDLNDFTKYKVDVIIEVAHPIVSEQFGEKFLEHADYMIGSPTALANQDLLDRLDRASIKNKRKILVPCGAFWGASDIKKMAQKQSLKGLKITMKKHPSSLKLEGSLKEMLANAHPLEKELVLYNDSKFNLKLSDTLRYYQRDSKAALDLLYRRSRRLADFELENKNLDKARLKHKDEKSAEASQALAKEKFEKISEVAKTELNDFKGRRNAMFKKSLIDFVEFQIKHSNAQVVALKNLVQVLSN